VNTIRIVFLGALLAGGTVFLSGCATTKQDNDVSSIPWNRPQDWEGTGAMGGFRPPGSPGY
jgi:hypothetical protein